MFIFPSVSQRIQNMREHYRSDDREICVARYRLITEFYKNNYALNGMLRKAKAFKYLCENMPVRIDEWDIIVGAATSKFGAGLLFPEIDIDWLPAELIDGSIRTRVADPYQISEEDAEFIIETQAFWKDKSLTSRCSATAPDGYAEHLGNGVSVFPGDGRAATPVGHFCPNYRKVIERGFVRIKADADAKIKNLEHQGILGSSVEQYNFYRGVSIVCEAMMIFARRYQAQVIRLCGKTEDPKRKAELKMIGESLGRIASGKCLTFYDALECVFLYQMGLALDGNLNGLSIGRLDQYLGKYYEQDIGNGTITEEYAQEMMDSFFLKIAEVCKVSSAQNAEAFPGYTSGQLITIGGVDIDGNDASNAVTYMILRSAGRLLLHDPPIAIRIHDKTPFSLWEAALETTKLVGGVPSFEYDEVIIPTLVKRGFTYEDALDYSIIGCVEPGGTGCDWPQTGGNGTEPYFVLPNALLMAINNGYVTDKRTLKTHLISSDTDVPEHPVQVGIPTGYLYEMTSFDEVLMAVKAQIEYFARWHVANTNMVEYEARDLLPIPLASATIDGCMESGKDVLAGGAKYNSTGVAGVGFGNLVDSLQMIKYLCYDEKICTTRQLHDALINDWKGYEDLQHFVKTNAPHYGNADANADKYTKWVSQVYADAFANLSGPRGAYAPGLWPVATHVLFGKTTGATPDGRNAGAPLSEGISPVQHMDVSGPTYTLLSTSSFVHETQTNGTLLNLKLHPTSMQSEDDVKKLAMLISAFFRSGGMEIQLNVVSAETLRAAQKNPAAYRDLVVRVAGFSTYFTSLHVEAQNELISRTENIL